MRGEVLSFDAATGAGWISGADGMRYGFTTADLAAPVPAHPGAALDFVPVGATATQVMAAPGFAAPAASVASGGMFSPITHDPVGEPDLSIWGYAKKCLRKYADFNGRARRKEYWSFILVEMLVLLPFYIAFFGLEIGIIAANQAPDGKAATEIDPATTVALFAFVAVGAIIFVLALARLLPSVAVLARRFHDVGLSAWWMLIAFVPFVGIAIYAVLFMPSQPGANIYGGYPKPVR